LLRALAVATGDESWRDLTNGALERIADRPGLPPWQARLIGASAALAEVSEREGRAVEIDPVDLVNQRAQLRGLTPQGAASAGGACRLLPTRDGWVAMSLNRAPDWELLPALFRTEQTRWDWESVASATAQATAMELESAAAELGLAVAVVPAAPPPVEQPWRITMPSAAQRTRAARRRVVDLSALWAGPLCSSLLRRAGAEVLTVESTSRPDGARQGDPALHRLLHDGNAFVALDFNDPTQRGELHRLVDEADVVVSAARMRALQQLGLDPFEATERRPGLTWVGISAYGLTGAGSNRIGYGDDTAVAGGLVNREPTPTFVGDAVADPITGIYAAVAALAVSASGGGVVDVALRDVAAHVARVAP
jgi:crotonobetainyl-CoA:carnitine CoA-transferase CaiB-like acyl-CoA transferase